MCNRIHLRLMFTGSLAMPRQAVQATSAAVGLWCHESVLQLPVYGHSRVCDVIIHILMYENSHICDVILHVWTNGHLGFQYDRMTMYIQHKLCHVETGYTIFKLFKSLAEQLWVDTHHISSESCLNTGHRQKVFYKKLFFKIMDISNWFANEHHTCAHGFHTGAISICSKSAWSACLFPLVVEAVGVGAGIIVVVNITSVASQWQPMVVPPPGTCV